MYMITHIKKYWNKINPEYHGIVFFVIALFASNYLWEFTVTGDEIETTVEVSILGVDVTAFFRWCVQWFTYCTHIVLCVVGTPHTLVNNIIGFANGHSMHVVAGCTAVKQLFIAFCILAFARGQWMRKLWYIPCAIMTLVAFNIFRLVVLSYIVRDYIEWFDFFHVVIMKYMFYATILLLWYIWDEHLRLR